MGLTQGMVWEVRENGNDANGGGYNPARSASSTDRSQQDNPHVTIDGATITAVVHTTTTQLNITGYTVTTPGDLGNIVNINGGTATAGRYEITAVDTVNNRWTLDRSAGTAAQTATGRMGGGLATPGIGGACTTLVDYVVCWVKKGTNPYLVDTNSNVAGGHPRIGARSHMRGYNVTRGDGGRPTLKCNANNAYCIYVNAQDAHFSDFILDGNKANFTGTFTTGQSGGLRAVLTRCFVKNGSSTGITSTWLALYCEITGCTNGSDGMNIGCVAYSNSGYGFTNHCIRCISYSNGGAGFSHSNSTATCLNCVAYGNTGAGFGGSPYSTTYINCISIQANSAWCFDVGSGTANITRNMYCAAKGTNTFRNPTQGLRESNITLTADPFVDGANGNFALNSTAGGGAALKALGYPSVFPAGLTAAKLDIGASQASGGGTRSHAG